MSDSARISIKQKEIINGMRYTGSKETSLIDVRSLQLKKDQSIKNHEDEKMRTLTKPLNEC